MKRTKGIRGEGEEEVSSLKESVGEGEQLERQSKTHTKIDKIKKKKGMGKGCERRKESRKKEEQRKKKTEG